MIGDDYVGSSGPPASLRRPAALKYPVPERARKSDEFYFCTKCGTRSPDIIGGDHSCLGGSTSRYDMYHCPCCSKFLCYASRSRHLRDIHNITRAGKRPRKKKGHRLSTGGTSHRLLDNRSSPSSAISVSESNISESLSSGSSTGEDNMISALLDPMPDTSPPDSPPNSFDPRLISAPNHTMYLEATSSPVSSDFGEHHSNMMYYYFDGANSEPRDSGEYPPDLSQEFNEEQRESFW